MRPVPITEPVPRDCGQPIWFSRSGTWTRDDLLDPNYYKDPQKTANDYQYTYNIIYIVSCTPYNMYISCSWGETFWMCSCRCHFHHLQGWAVCPNGYFVAFLSKRRAAAIAEGGLRVPLLFTLVCGAGSFYGDYFLEFGLRCAAWTSTSSSSGWALHHLLPLRGRAVHLRGFLRAGALGWATWSSTCWWSDCALLGPRLRALLPGPLRRGPVRPGALRRPGLPRRGPPWPGALRALCPGLLRPRALRPGLRLPGA